MFGVRVKMVGSVVLLLATSCVSSGENASLQPGPADDAPADQRDVAADSVPSSEYEADGLSAERVDGEASEYGDCFFGRLDLVSVWVEDPVFGAVEPTTLRSSDGTPRELLVGDIVGTARVLRAVGTFDGDLSDFGFVRDSPVRRVVAETPSGDGPDVALVINNNNQLGDLFMGLVDTTEESVFAWTACDDDWIDYTPALRAWSGATTPAAMLEALRALLMAPRSTAEEAEVRHEEIRRLSTALVPPVAALSWIERTPHERSWIDEDLPGDVRDRLTVATIRLGPIEPTGDPDLALCLRQPTAGTGYCFIVDALAASDAGAIQVSALPSEPLLIVLERESRWDDPTHGIVVAELDLAFGHSISVAPEGETRASRLEELAKQLGIVVTPLPDDGDLDAERQGVLGGLAPRTS